MRFELKVALNYLIPRKKRLGAALISFLSIGLISLIVWLVLLFLSITSGIEKNWITKLTSLQAPVRIAPTAAYFRSPFYQIDAFSSSSLFSYKTIGEKKEALLLDPYDPEIDPELPFAWEQTKDPVQTLFSILEDLKENAFLLDFQDYEISGALMRVSLSSSAILSQMSYLLSTPEKNPQLNSLLSDPVETHFQNGFFQVFLPKSYESQGVKKGDTGHLSYLLQMGASTQEQKIPMQVGGFYDPGILPVGNRCLIAPPELVRSIYKASRTFSPDGTPTNGVFVWCGDVSKAKKLKELIQTRIETEGIAPYWEVAFFEEFESAKPLFAQFQTDRSLLLLIGAILLAVACSNIISLLILLVSEKKKEIAIFRSMGASSRSIALIFALLGAIIGTVSTLLGACFAFFTLSHLDRLLGWLSWIQGKTSLGPLLDPSALPKEMSTEALWFILIGTPLLSIAAGLLPAWQATRVHPTALLRGEG